MVVNGMDVLSKSRQVFTVLVPDRKIDSQSRLFKMYDVFEQIAKIESRRSKKIEVVIHGMLTSVSAK